jgi:hypothetical protein
MTLTATNIFNRLTEFDSNDNDPFTLADGTSESDVQTWMDSNDVSKLESEADSQIERTTVTELSAPQGIGSDNLSVADVIESRNDDPEDFKAAYILRASRTFVQYFKRGVGSKEPIPEADVQSELDDHVAEMVNRAVNAELLKRAKTEFCA